MNDCLLHMLKRLALLSVVVLIGLQTTLLADDSTPAKSEAKTVRLLTVGNSFSANATHYLSDLAKARGNVLIHRPLVVGGASLELHWGRAELHEKDPQDAAGLYGKRSLKQELASEPWDFVTIQQASIKNHDVATYRPFAKQLRDYIKQHAPQAEVLIHQTWAYRRDDPRFAVAKPKAGEPATQAEMYRMLTDAYTTIADELGLRRIPVGDAFYLADTDPQWGYQPDQPYDFQQKEPTTLPNQTHSLHVGWRLTKEKGGSHKLTMDGHHANSAGEYLGACVWYEVLFGDSAVGNEFIPMGLAKDDARFLQETAHKAVTASRTRQLSSGRAGRSYPPQMTGCRIETYKTIGDTKLNLYVFSPSAPKYAPAIVFFFGGGWKNGSPQQFETQCRELAKRGMVAITADYRVESRHGVKPTQCLADARSAVRWVRTHADQLGVDPQRIAAGGGSAGGHLAACTAFISEFDEPSEDKTVSAVPNALVLFNPALVLAPIEGFSLAEGFGTRVPEERMGTKPENLSPAHHITRNGPPTIIFHGREDTTVPFASAEAFTAKMKSLGNRCELHGFDDQKHGFFNSDEFKQKTLAEADKFLVSLGWLKPAK